MSSAFLIGVALFLVLNVAAGLWRVNRGPTPPDRMLAAQLFGTTGVAVLVLLSRATGSPAPIDVALVLALLAVVVAVAFVQRGWPAGDASRETARPKLQGDVSAASHGRTPRAEGA